MLARKLKIPEGKIDDLEKDHHNVTDRVLEILHYHKNSSDRSYWQLNLCDALENAGRKDLSWEVKNIIAMHSH